MSPDPVTVAAAGVVLGGVGKFMNDSGVKDLMLKVLGPTFGRAGQELSKLIFQNRDRNFFEILEASKRRIEKNDIPIENDVRNNVLAEIYINASFYDGAVYTEYFGGVLASAKMHNRNDISQSILKTITRLSSYDLRFHYIYYMCLSKKFKGKTIHLGDTTYSKLCGIFISKKAMLEAMDFTEEEKMHQDIIFNSCLTTLARENLISVPYSYATKGFQIDDVKMPEDGFYIIPSSVGASLLLWACGYGMTSSSEIFSKTIELAIQEEILIPEATFFGFKPESGYAATVGRAKDFVDYLKKEEK